MPDPRAQTLGRQLAACRQAASPLNYFHSVILRRPALSPSQLLVAETLLEEGVRTVAVPAGHAVGKTYLAATVVLFLLFMNPGCYVVTTGPSYEQLRDVLWTEIEAALGGAPLLRGLKYKFSKEKLRLWVGPQWGAMGLNPAKLESVQGRHRPRVFLVVDEASGVSNPMFETLSSLNPHKTLLISNPLRTSGHFYDQAKAGESGSDPATRTIRLPSTGSPHAHLPESPCGLADATWIARQVADYGEAAARVRVGGHFPDSSEDQLVPAPWLLRARRAAPPARLPDGRMGWPGRSGGHCRMGVDLSEGSGGDSQVVVVRDDLGVLEWHASNRESIEETAARAALLARKYRISAARIAFDGGGGWGSDFNNRLAALGFAGAFRYLAQAPGTREFADLRTALHYLLRHRLDPERMVDGRLQPEFYLPPDLLDGRAPRQFGLARELQEVSHREGPGGRRALRKSEEVKAALRGSTDYLSALILAFARPNV